MFPRSPKMAEAMRVMRAWACDFTRDPEDAHFRPTRFSTEPPAISPHTMGTLIRRRFVRVVDHTGRGQARVVRLPR